MAGPIEVRRAALPWFGKEQGVPARGVALMPEWAGLKTLIKDRYLRARLSGLMRYCSAKAIAPAAVDDAVVEALLRYRSQITGRTFGAAAQRSIARAWNTNACKIEGWPRQLLTEPPRKTAEGPDWNEFPEGLRRDVHEYLATLRKRRKNAAGQRMRPCKASSI